MSHSAQMYTGFVAIAVICVMALVFRDGPGRSSSWPTWLFVPVAVMLALPLGSYSKPPDQLRSFGLALFVLVIVRWGIAVATRENSRGWIVYLMISSFALTLSIFGFAAP
jgi:hypothetical protein